MDLLQLLDNDSSDSDDDDNSVDNKNSGKEEQAPDNKKNDENDVTRKRKRGGDVSIMPSSQVSPSIFVRTIPYRRGHWSGHVMVPVTCFSKRDMNRSVIQFQKHLESCGHSGVIVLHETVHLSLSRHFSLQEANLEPFVAKLTERLSKERATRLYVDQSVGQILVNDEKTRSFWNWKIHPNGMLTRIVSHINDILKQYNQQPYYENPIFHVSLASFAGFVECPFPNQHDNTDEESSDEEEEEDSDEEENDYILVDRVHCVFGNCKEFVIKLQSS